VTQGSPGEARREHGRLRLEFWTAFKEYMAAHSRVRCARATSEDWMNHSADLNGGSLFSILRSRLGEIGVQFALDDATAPSIYAFLQTRKRDIDSALAARTRWHNPADMRTALIEVRRKAELADMDDWPRQFGWLHAQLELFQEVFWPLVGRVPASGEPRLWDESSFFAELEAINATSVGPARAIVEWAGRHMPAFSWGRGRQAGSLTPRLVSGDVRYQLFSLTTAGTVIFRFADLKRSEPFDSSSRRMEILQRLNESCGVMLPPKVIKQRPSLPLPMFTDDRVRGGLLVVATCFVEEAKLFHLSLASAMPQMRVAREAAPGRLIQ
jgi:hypothetical protein